ncbi:MAG: cohesin domain-containing protein [Patescibacteria group bacterium]
MLKFKNIFVFFICVFGFLFFIFDFCQAAILYFEPSAGEYHQNDTFIIEARIDTQGEYINTIEANLTFSEEVLEIKDFSKGDSILSLWVDEPKFSEGILSFTGGIPGGYQGKDGLLVKIIFQAKNTGFAEIKFLDSSKVLLNDGKGTKAKSEIRKGTYNILRGEEMVKNEWQEEISKDKTPPQPFTIEINQDPLIFEGEYFITFSTIDKETGIDHYEIREGNRDWKAANSPYVLENQKLMATIWVKAIDKAGNYWIESIKFSQKLRWIIYGILGLLSLIFIFVIMKIIRPKIKKLPK